MKQVKVLGPGYPRCDALVTLVKEAATKAGIGIAVEKVTDYAEIAKAGVVSTHRRQAGSRRGLAETGIGSRLAQRMKVLHLAPHLSAALLAACASQPAAAPASTGACQSTISVYGSRAKLNENPDTVAVSLRDVALSPNAIGYGPGAGYLAELTLVDGAWQIARASGPEAVTLDTDPADNAGAMFLVTASPDAWTQRPLDNPVRGMTDLEARISQSAMSSGCVPGAVAFKVSGTIRDADWSVVGRPSGARGRIDEAAVTLIGLYDPVEADRYFMPKGRSVHVHILTDDGSLSGHLDNFGSLEAGTLSIPE